MQLDIKDLEQLQGKLVENNLDYARDWLWGAISESCEVKAYNRMNEIRDYLNVRSNRA